MVLKKINKWNHVLGIWVFFLTILYLPSVILAESRTNVVPAFKDLQYRNLGPFRAGAWISDIAVPKSDKFRYKRTFYVAARNGGVWKTVNNGTTFYPVFDDYGTNAIGAVEVAPSDPETIWVGTGEDSYARSSYSGNGIYKSSNGGIRFKNMGLRDSHHIGKIIIHPKVSNIVYAAVMGHLFSKNSQRGVFKTVNGGKNWQKVLYIDNRTGVVDLCMDPQNPNILFAAAYEKERTPWHFEAGGKKSRIYRTKNGGQTWEQLSRGLPQGNLGRIGIDLHADNPQIIYSVIQNLNPKPGLSEKNKKGFDEFTDHSYDDLIGGEVYRSDDGGDSWRKVSNPKVNVSGKAAYSFNEITVDPKDPERLYIIGVYMQYSLDGGRTWPRWPRKNLFLRNFGDVRTFWIDPDDPRHMMLGSDGGLYISWDGGLTTDHLYNIPLGEVYNVEVDSQKPYNIYAGLQDHEIWKGPSNGWSGSVGLEDWVIVGLWDGMYCKVNPKNNRWLYFTSQFGKHHRVDQEMGERKEITPRAAKGRPFYRFTWNTPLVLSPHDPDTLYTGGQMLLCSSDRGNTWKHLSPDLTNNDPIKIAGKGHMMFCTITTISESGLKKGLIWVGTDDGRVHITTDKGSHWQEMTRKIEAAGGPLNTWVSRVAASRHDVQTAYVVKSGYREDIFKPFVFKTNDLGKTWENISGNLPDAPVSVIFEDQINPQLLFAGTDKGVYFSLQGGNNWHPLVNNMPPTPVRDLLVHPETGDLVVGTYGRGVWVTNISPLQQINSEILAKDFHLFDIKDGTVANYSQRASWGNYQMTGDSHLRTENEPSGLKIYHYQKTVLDKPLKLVIKNGNGKEVFSQEAINLAGIQKLNWNNKDRKSGSFTITLTDGKSEITKTGILTKRLIWPVK